jgi:hypothetical protein
LAWYTQTGIVARISFAILAVLTGTTVVLGWREAVTRRFQVHLRWMTRCFVLLCSAVVLRVFAGFATVVGVQSLWFDPVMSWASWIVPLLAYEIGRVISDRSHRRPLPSLVKSSVIDASLTRSEAVSKPGPAVDTFARNWN